MKKNDKSYKNNIPQTFAHDFKSSFEKPQIPDKINTASNDKLREFIALFLKYGKHLSSTAIDLPEIKATPIEVVVHKASNIGPGILVEDTSLDIEDANVGINIKWLVNNLENFIEKKAIWTVLLAVCQGEFVYVYEGKVSGRIVHKRGKSKFGFDPFFLPDGSTETLAQDKPDNVNARALAVEKLFKSKPVAIHPLLKKWDGPWQ